MWIRYLCLSISYQNIYIIWFSQKTAHASAFSQLILFNHLINVHNKFHPLLFLAYALILWLADWVARTHTSWEVLLHEHEDCIFLVFVGLIIWIEKESMYIAKSLQNMNIVVWNMQTGSSTTKWPEAYQSNDIIHSSSGL